MKSSQALVRQHVARLAEHHLKDGAVLDGLCAMAEDTDFRVRFQVALSLGASSSLRVPAVLRSLAHRDAGHRDMILAILTSVPGHEADLAADMKTWKASLKSADQRDGAPIPIMVTNTNPDREKVVKRYAAVAGLTGDPATGRALFTNVCSACHRLKNEGVEIGPDLGMVAAKPVAQIIEAILDPNRAVESRYLTHTLTLKSGRELNGLIIEETPNNFTVRTATGVEAILRTDVEKRSSTTRSLMPEGLESLLTPQHVADIIAWIRKN